MEVAKYLEKSFYTSKQGVREMTVSFFFFFTFLMSILGTFFFSLSTKETKMFHSYKRNGPFKIGSLQSTCIRYEIHKSVYLSWELNSSSRTSSLTISDSFVSHHKVKFYS